jgi:threonine dehydratase
MRNESKMLLKDIYQARKAIDSWIYRTPLVRSNKLSSPAQRVFLKLETVHDIGAFKIRGAFNRLLNLGPEQKNRGVVATSTGNHGRAIAYAAGRLGIRAVVFMSNLVSADKITDIEAYGAEVHIVGDNFDETRTAAEALVTRENMLMVDPFDDPFIIAGQGTIGLEILEDLPKVDTLLVPVGGGGMISGIALALKSASPNIRVIGVSMERGAAMYESINAGKPIEVEELTTLADNLGGGIGLDNRYTFNMVQTYVDDLILVSEDQIASAIKYAFEQEKIIIEGAASVGIAALMNNLVENMGKEVVTIISSRNINMEVLHQILCNTKP